MKRIAGKHATTKLERAALRWINDKAQDYNGSGVEGAVKDLFYGGCASGVVSGLIYYSDTLKFYSQYKAEIHTMLKEAIDNCGCDGPAGVFGDKWDKDDPLADDTSNRNLLAWFGFEEAARNVANRAGIEI